MTRVAIRTDASIEIGSGHVMRCLALGTRLKQAGAEVLYVCRDHHGNLNDMIGARADFRVRRLPHHPGWTPGRDDDDSAARNATHAAWLGADWRDDSTETAQAISAEYGSVDWLIADHYAVDSRWERKLRPLARNLMVIDDLADRAHDCDIVLDQNYYLDQDTRYDGLVPPHCVKLLGPRHALLRPEFLEARGRLRQRDGAVRRIFVYFGSTDVTNETAKVIRAMQIIDRDDIALDIVLGPTNPRAPELRALARGLPAATFHSDPNMASLIAGADLGIGAGGATTWERCVLGLPTLTAILAGNQLATTLAVASIPALWYLGWGRELTAQDYADTLRRLLDDPDEVRVRSRNALQLVDVGHQFDVDSLLLGAKDERLNTTRAGNG